MKLPKELTTVTKFSKYLAIVLFIALPIVGFLLGMRYQEMMNLANRQQMESNLTVNRIPTPTPNETANWKTYKNVDVGYQYSYPSNWENHIQCDFPKESTCYGAFESSTLINPQMNFPNGYFYFQNNKGFACESQISEERIKTKEDFNNLKEYTQNIQDIKSQVFEGTVKSSGDYRKRVFIDRNHNCHELYYATVNNPADIEVFDQILSTFQFTSP